ncbi:ammonium transporter [Wenzhouxiangella sp. XN79A]|uniref:ammonium transporter n=1 Tax=Wenzhouxiangella sp. XN79A TaxID=2724193 RepID=UPI00144A981C|nr:ammonium transporter [Wenzhouxiangella sp. XN79A]NKI34840.1 ammonium transporter [Wenzhouxiangella sp. XN79A]
MTEIEYALNTFYLLVCAALVMWMAAGFTMLEAGLVRARNTVEILTKNVALYAIACLMYFLIGYQLMYPGEGVNAFWPGIGFGVSAEHALADVTAEGSEIAFSSLADFMFQVVFVATAMSIVSGAVAERMKLWAFLVFAVVMTGVIYPWQGYWSWGGGLLSDLGYSDYAGGGIVHMAGAAAALAGVLLLGPRAGKYTPDGRPRAIPGANLPLATLGMFILWMGWFGFNGGSELAVAGIGSANAVAKVFVNTNLAAAAGLVAALLLARFLFGKADLTMALNGALAGLVSITAGPSTPDPGLAVLIGAAGGLLVVVSILGLDRIRIDDPVGAISVHGVCGILGLLVVPLSNDEASLVGQLAGIGLIGGFVFVTSLAVWAALKATIGIRVHPDDERAGLDFAECGMEAYPDFAHGGD